MESLNAFLNCITLLMAWQLDLMFSESCSAQYVTYWVIIFYFFLITARHKNLHINSQYFGKKKEQLSKMLVLVVLSLGLYKRPLAALNFSWRFQCSKQIEANTWIGQGPFRGQLIQLLGHLSYLKTAGAPLQDNVAFNCWYWEQWYYMQTQWDLVFLRLHSYYKWPHMTAMGPSNRGDEHHVTFITGNSQIHCV